MRCRLDPPGWWLVVVVIVSLGSFARSTSTVWTEHVSSVEDNGRNSRSLLAAGPENSIYDCRDPSIGDTPLLLSDEAAAASFSNTILTNDTVLTNVTFKYCTGGALILSSVHLTTVSLVNCTFISNSNGSNYGGALRILGKVQANLTGCTFTNNTAKMGAAIYSTAGDSGVGSLTLKRCSFDANQGQGTVYVNQGVVKSISGTNFTRNYLGSAVYFADLRLPGFGADVVDMLMVRFVGNSANNSDTLSATDVYLGRLGGAMYISNNYMPIQIVNSTFIGNLAGRKGGAISASGGSMPVFLRTCNVSNNVASLYGGGIHAEEAALVNISGVVFKGNTASQGGSICALTTAELIVTDSTFTSNTAAKFGGAISGSGGAKLSITSSTFHENSATYAGAVECWSCGSMTSTLNTFTGNFANGSAGAVALYGATSNVTLQHNVFENNHALIKTPPTSKSCSRASTGVGGALCAAIEAVLDLKNNTFTSNHATSGGAMYLSRQCDVQVDDDSCRGATVNIFESNTLTNNTAVGGAGGAVYALNITLLAVSCTTNDVTRYWNGSQIMQWPYGADGCPNNWASNSVTDGGYGASLATGIVGLRLQPGVESSVANFSSNSAVPVVLEMYDAFNTSMTKGSYEVDSTVVSVDFTTNPDLAGYLVGGYSNTSIQGIITFNSLKLRAPPGDYNLTFYPLPADLSDSSVFVGTTVMVSVRTCWLGEITTSTGDMCTTCAGPDTFSFTSSNSSCDQCPSDALCLHANLLNSSTADLGYLIPQDGYWHSSPFSPQVHECPVSEACSYSSRSVVLGEYQEASLSVQDMELPTPAGSVIANITPYWVLQCATGYTGPLCAQCVQPGYGWRPSGSCYVCPKRSLNTLYYCLSYLLTIALLFWTVRATLSRSLEESRALVREARNAGSLQQHGRGGGGGGGGNDVVLLGGGGGDGGGEGRDAEGPAAFGGCGTGGGDLSTSKHGFKSSRRSGLSDRSAGGGGKGGGGVAAAGRAAAAAAGGGRGPAAAAAATRAAAGGARGRTAAAG